MKTIIHSEGEEINSKNLSLDKVKNLADACAEDIAKAIVKFETRAGVPVKNVALRSLGRGVGVLGRLPVDVQVNTENVSVGNGKVLVKKGAKND